MAISFDAAVAAHKAGDLETAEQGYLRHLDLDAALYNLSRVYRDTDRPIDAERTLRTLIQHAPDFALARRQLAMSLLTQRRYAEAWPLYEARREILGLQPPPLPIPEWMGEPMAGRTLLVMGEQGLGDQLMFGRFAAALRADGARVIMAGKPELRRLFAEAGFVVPPQPSADAWAHSGSLPLRMGLAGVSGQDAAYLAAPGRTGGGVGVMARGNPTHQNDQHRSMDPASAEALHSLGRDLSPAVTGAKDMADTAAIVARLDLVIAVDTAVAHLALALGKPCWLLLPRIALDWRWNDAVRSDWYPRARFFRQPAAGDWASVLDEVRAALQGEGLA